MSASIPQVTVDTIDGIKNLSDAFVYVTSLNTTYYVDDKHRILTAWKGIVEDDEYDINANPRGLRSQLLYTIVTDQQGNDVPVVVFYDKEGNPHILNDEGQAAADFDILRQMIQDEASERETQDNLIRSSVSSKQNRLLSGHGIDITNDIVSNTGVIDINPSDNIQVTSNDGIYTVSATDTKYSAGTGIRIDANNVISLDQTLRASWGVAETGTVVLGSPLASNATVAINIDVSALDFDDATKYAILLQPEYDNAYWDKIALSWSEADSDAQTGVVYVHNNDTGSIPATTTFRYTVVGEGYGGSGGSNINLYSGTGQNTDGAMTQKATTDELNTLGQNLLNVQTNLQNQIDSKASQSELSAKQDRLTAGANIAISGNTISAVDTKYTAGTGISISAGNVISATSQATGLKLQTGTVDIGEGVLLAEDTIYGVYE